MLDSAPSLIVLVTALVGAMGGLAGLVGLWQANSTKRKIESETAGNIVSAADQLIRLEREAARRHREECERELRELAARVEILERHGSSTSKTRK